MFRDAETFLREAEANFRDAEAGKGIAPLPVSLPAF